MNVSPMWHECRLARTGSAVLLLMAALLGCSALKPSSEGDVSLQRKQRNEAAAREFDKARDLAEFEAAQGRWHEHDAKGCRERLEALLARNPQHLDSRLLLAEVLLADRRTQEAIRCLEPALTTHAHDPRVQYTMGLVLDTAGQTDRALSYYQQAARLEPTNELYAVVQQKALDGARAKTTAKSLPAAVPPVASSKRTATSAAKPAAELAAVIPTGYVETLPPANEARPTDAILQPISILAEFGPRQSDSSQDAGRKQNSGSTETATPTHREENATAADLLAQAARTLGDGSAADAADLLRRAIGAKPEDPQVPISAAVLVLQHNRPELAVELIEPAVKRFPDSAALQRVLGTAYYRRGDYPSSQVALQQALSLDKTSALSYFLMGCTLAKLGQADAAEIHFQQAQRLDSRYAERRADAAGS